MCSKVHWRQAPQFKHVLIHLGVQAASFLQDDCTEELIVAELSTALEPQWATQKGKRRGQPAVSNQSRYHDPTPGQQARALEVHPFPKSVSRITTSATDMTNVHNHSCFQS